MKLSDINRREPFIAPSDYFSGLTAQSILERYRKRKRRAYIRLSIAASVAAATLGIWLYSLPSKELAVQPPAAEPVLLPLDDALEYIAESDMPHSELIEIISEIPSEVWLQELQDHNLLPDAEDLL